MAEGGKEAEADKHGSEVKTQALEEGRQGESLEKCVICFLFVSLHY